MLACFRMKGLTAKARMVLATIAYHDGRGGSFPSDETIARETGLKNRTYVLRYRQALWKANRLRWRHGKHSNIYTIAYHDPFPPEELPVHCQKFSDSVAKASLSEKKARHCQKFSDTNRKEREEKRNCRSPGSCRIAADGTCETCLRDKKGLVDYGGL